MCKIGKLLNDRVVSWLNTFITEFGIDIGIALLTLVESGDVSKAALLATISATARMIVKKYSAKGIEKLKEMQ